MIAPGESGVGEAVVGANVVGENTGALVLGASGEEVVEKLYCKGVKMLDRHVMNHCERCFTRVHFEK